LLGQKDYQQCLVIKKMMADKRHQAEVIVCPTVREPSGLAMSSRNMRLTPEGRVTASHLFKELSFLKEKLPKIPFSQLHEASLARLKNHEFDVEYLALADADSLQPAEKLEADKKYVLLVAAWLEGVRLIDNLVIG
jgi:pantoate--beta-alanine ligase